MIHIPYFHQKEDYTCGPAAMKMVLDFFGVKLGEAKLKKIMRANKKIGTKHEALIKEATKEGFYCYVHNNANLNQIKSFIDKELPVIVHYIEPLTNDEHYSVVISYRGNKIVMNDPWVGKNFKIKNKEFEARWHGDGNMKWIMVISKKPFEIGKQYLPRR